MVHPGQVASLWQGKTDIQPYTPDTRQTLTPRLGFRVRSQLHHTSWRHMPQFCSSHKLFSNYSLSELSPRAYLAWKTLPVVFKNRSLSNQTQKPFCCKAAVLSNALLCSLLGNYYVDNWVSVNFNCFLKTFKAIQRSVLLEQNRSVQVGNSVQMSPLSFAFCSYNKSDLIKVISPFVYYWIIRKVRHF